MPEKVVDKETKRLRKDLEEKVMKRKVGKRENLENTDFKKVDGKKQKNRKNIAVAIDDEYEEWENFSF